MTIIEIIKQLNRFRPGKTIMTIATYLLPKAGRNQLCAALLSILLVLGISSNASAVTVDGIFNPNEGYTNVQPLFFQLQSGTMVQNPGTLAWTTDAAGNVFVAFVQPLSINDNTYGANAIGWGSKKHSFSDLTGSDKAQFNFTNGAGQMFIYTLDYISQSKTTPSGYASLGVTGGDGSVAKNNAKGGQNGGGQVADVLAWGTSLAYNLNILGHKSFTTDSPATTPRHLNADGTIDYSQGYNDPASAPGWRYEIAYEIEIAASAFGPSGFSGVTVPFAHDSPSKFGENQIITVPEPGNYAVGLAAIALLVGTQARTILKRKKATVQT